MTHGKRVLLAVVIGAVVGAVLGSAAGLMANEGWQLASTMLTGISGAISAGLVFVLLSPRRRA